MRIYFVQIEAKIHIILDKNAVKYSRETPLGEDGRRLLSLASQLVYCL